MSFIEHYFLFTYIENIPYSSYLNLFVRKFRLYNREWEDFLARGNRPLLWERRR